MVNQHNNNIKHHNQTFFKVMDIRIDHDDNVDKYLMEEKTCLLDTNNNNNAANKNLVQLAIAQTFESTSHLANLLPTGTVLAFQLLSPVFTNQGACDSISRAMTAGLVILCGLSSFLSSFTDSFKDDNGQVVYGFATVHGLWVIDGSTVLPADLAERYRLRVIDFVHAILSVMVFAAVALFDQNVVSCFYPAPSDEAREMLTAMPVGIGVLCSMLFVVFPTTRRGIGFPVSTN